jgi:hypothetical protein
MSQLRKPSATAAAITAPFDHTPFRTHADSVAKIWRITMLKLSVTALAALVDGENVKPQMM